MRDRPITLSALAFVAACSSHATPAPPPPTTAPPAPNSATSATPPPADPNADGPHGRATDVCGQILVVAWRGADHAPDGVTRSEPDAHARADELRTRIAGGAAFAEVAGAE